LAAEEGNDRGGEDVKTIGRLVLVTGAKHPWKGHVAKVVGGLKKPSIRILPKMLTVRHENGSEFMVRPDELKFLS
jgi:hypothetical protein